MNPLKPTVILGVVWLYGATGFAAELAQPISASPSALTITMNGIGPAVDGKALNRANKLIQSGLKQGFLAEQVNYHQGIEGGLSTCVTIKANTSEKQITSFEKKLRAIKPNPRTTAYSVERTSMCASQSSTAPKPWQGEQSQYSGVTNAQQRVIKDEQAWQDLWKTHTSNQTPAPVVPVIDFSKQMVVAVFLGERPDGCYSVSIDANVITTDQKRVVNYAEEIRVEGSCDAAITHPAAMIVINRSDLPVEFVELNKPVTPTPSPAPWTGETGQFSGMTTSKQQVIKDAQAWTALWHAHYPAMTGMPAPPAVPVIDFSKKMVVAVFMGEHGNGCYSTTVESTTATAAKLTVNYSERTPAPDEGCDAVMTQPFSMLAIDRSDLPVEFAKLVNRPAQKLAFTSVLKVTGGGTRDWQPEYFVARDQASWQIRWDSYDYPVMWSVDTPLAPKPAVPAVDFSQNMVIGITEIGGGCSRNANIESIEKIDGAKIVVRYYKQLGQPEVYCTTDVYAIRDWVMVERSDLPVEFVRVSQSSAAPWTGETMQYSSITLAQQLVIKDGLAWNMLWKNYTSREVPIVDFSKQMVVAVFMGEKANSCYGTQIESTQLIPGQKLIVNYREWVSQPLEGSNLVICAANVSQPAAMAVIDRTDLPVEFVNIR